MIYLVLCLHMIHPKPSENKKEKVYSFRIHVNESNKKIYGSCWISNKNRLDLIWEVFSYALYVIDRTYN